MIIYKDQHFVLEVGKKTTSNCGVRCVSCNMPNFPPADPMFHSTRCQQRGFTPIDKIIKLACMIRYLDRL